MNSKFFLKCLVFGGLASPLFAQKTYNINVMSPQSDFANAAIEDFSFDPIEPQAPFEYSGTHWNNVLVEGGNNTFSDVLDSEGNPSGISLYSTYTSTWGYKAPSQILTNYMWLMNEDRHVVEFSGLEPGSRWDLYILSQGDKAGQGGFFEISGKEQQSSGADPTAIDWTEGENYVLFSNVSADESGKIPVNWYAEDGGYGIINGMQLVRIPEPTTYAMIVGLAALVFCQIRRKRRQ